MADNADEPTRPEWNMTVSHAAEHGTRRDLLLALRRRLAAALEDERTQPRDLSPITLRLKEIATEIEELDAHASDPIDAAANIPDEPFDGSEL